MNKFVHKFEPILIWYFKTLGAILNCVTLLCHVKDGLQNLLHLKGMALPFSDLSVVILLHVLDSFDLHLLLAEFLFFFVEHDIVLFICVFQRLLFTLFMLKLLFQNFISVLLH